MISFSPASLQIRYPLGSDGILEESFQPEVLKKFLLAGETIFCTLDCMPASISARTEKLLPDVPFTTIFTYLPEVSLNFFKIV